MATKTPSIAGQILETYPIQKGSLVVIHAELERWDQIRYALMNITDPLLQGTQVLLLEPGERLDALSPEELADAGLRRI